MNQPPCDPDSLVIERTHSVLFASERREDEVVPQLVLAFNCSRPATPPLRLTLTDLDEVPIGRGDGRVSREVGADGLRRLRVEPRDPFLSTRHSRLIPVAGGGWAVEDLSSKNGSFVNGSRIAHATPLDDGDVVELGGTFFVYRAGGLLARGDVLDAPLARGPAAGLDTMVAALARSFAAVADVARSMVSVIVRGEVGTGKEVVATAVHAMSGRTGAFVAVNCGALPESLVESELFGHRKGAFSGANEDRTGLIRSADRGTLFLDEIAELPPHSQVKLLRVLQEREVVPVGATRPQPVDLRVVAASHRDLAAMVDAGQFRADLFSRLSGFFLELPPLRQRREDLGLLIAALLGRMGAQGQDVRFRPVAARCLFQHPWPMNVRELDRCLGAAVVLARGGAVNLEHLPSTVRGAQVASSDAAVPDAAAPAPGASVANEGEPDTEVGPPPHDAEELERVLALLVECRGNLSAAGRILGKAPGQLRRWLRRRGIDPDAYRK